MGLPFHFQQTKTPRLRLGQSPKPHRGNSSEWHLIVKIQSLCLVFLLYPLKTARLNELKRIWNFSQKNRFLRSGLTTSQRVSYHLLRFTVKHLKNIRNNSIHARKMLSNPYLFDMWKGCEQPILVYKKSRFRTAFL